MNINEKRHLNTFLEYVKTDSESFFENNFAKKLVSDLEALGLRIDRDEIGAKAGSDTNNIYAYLDGDSSLEPIMFSAHLDTVTPGKGINPVVTEEMVTTDGNTILGSDDKAAVAAVMEAIRVVKENNLTTRPVEFLFTICEEVGLLGSKNADYSKLKAKKAIVLDSGGMVGSIVVEGPGSVIFQAEMVGKAAHAGIEPEKGVSAIWAMAEAVANMDLLRIDDETTANIGTFKAEYPSNIVAESALIDGEIRCLSNEKLMMQESKIKKCLDDAAAKHGATLNYKMDTYYLGYKIADDSDLLALIKEKFLENGITANCKRTGGGSDANVFALNGIEAINISIGMQDVHSRKENILISDLNKIAQIVLSLIRV